MPKSVGDASSDSHRRQQMPCFFFCRSVRQQLGSRLFPPPIRGPVAILSAFIDGPPTIATSIATTQDDRCYLDVAEIRGFNQVRSPAAATRIMTFVNMRMRHGNA